MVRFAFRKGLRFLWGAKGFTLIRRLVNGNLQLEDDLGEVTNLTEVEMHRRWRTGDWQIDEESLGASSNVFYFTSPKDLRALPEADQVEAKRRLAYLQGIQRLFDLESHRTVFTRTQIAPKIDQLAKELGDESPPSAITIWRWRQRFAITNCVMTLVKRTSRAGRTSDQVQRSIFDEAVCEVFLTPQKMPGKTVVDAVQTKVARINQSVAEEDRIEAPSPATVYRWLKALEYEVVMRARKGKDATARELRSVIGGVKVDKILSRIELDHTPLDHPGDLPGDPADPRAALAHAGHRSVQPVDRGLLHQLSRSIRNLGALLPSHDDHAEGGHPGSISGRRWAVARTRSPGHSSDG